MTDAILVLSYGGPRGPEDVLPFMRNATRGRGIPDERLVEVSGHYQMFGGVSPINDRNAELMDALGEALRERGIDLPVVIGNRNWTPYVSDALRELAAAGAKDLVVLATAAYSSYSGCRQYREDLAGALVETGLEFGLTKVGPFAETDGFVAANADAVRAAVAELPGLADARVLFVTHSIPSAMDAVSGPESATGERGNTYAVQHRRVAERVAAVVGLADDAWEIAYCSRSGAPHVPWLEPDVNDRMAELAAEGVRAVVTVPFGFINDHMEVVYDLDTQARETATELGLGYVRAATVGVHPAFVAMLADSIAACVGAEPVAGAGGTSSTGAQRVPQGTGGAGASRQTQVTAGAGASRPAQGTVGAGASRQTQVTGGAGASSQAQGTIGADPAASTLGGLRTCSATCCGSGRPGGPTRPAACAAPQ